ncbi:MAG: LysR substrate-binding domain-containing protein, partial [Hyphomicrobiales bacterium]
AMPGEEIVYATLTIHELARLPIITFPRRSAPYNMIKELFRGRDLAPVRLNASASLATTIRLAVNAMGVALLPPVAIERELKAGHLHLFETDFSPPDLQYVAIYPATPLNPLAEIISDKARSIAAGSHSAGEP